MKTFELRFEPGRRILLASGIALLLSRQVPAVETASPKVLTLYFTWSGGSEVVAREVHRLLGGALARIEPVTPYPAEYRPTTQVAIREFEENARPAIRPVPPMEEADVIVLCHPIWSGRMPRALFTLLEGRDFAGKPSPTEEAALPKARRSSRTFSLAQGSCRGSPSTAGAACARLRRSGPGLSGAACFRA